MGKLRTQEGPDLAGVTEGISAGLQLLTAPPPSLSLMKPALPPQARIPAARCSPTPSRPHRLSPCPTSSRSPRTPTL